MQAHSSLQTVITMEIPSFPLMKLMNHSHWSLVTWYNTSLLWKMESLSDKLWKQFSNDCLQRRISCCFGVGVKYFFGWKGHKRLTCTKSCWTVKHRCGSNCFRSTASCDILTQFLFVLNGVPWFWTMKAALLVAELLAKKDHLKTVSWF